MISASSNSKNENLQILRFVAAALVLITHITFYIHERVTSSWAIWHNGEIGVPIFFVISGFVMQFTGGKFTLNANGATDFLCRRFARILPLYWLITTVKIIIALAIPTVVLHNQPTWAASLGSYALFPMFNAAGEVRPIHGVAWTLLHEMFFYYLFSLALFFNKKPLIWVSISIIGLWIIGYLTPPTSAVMVVLTDKINLMFVAGMLIARLHQKSFHLPRHAALAILIISIGVIFIDDFTSFKRNYLFNIHFEAAVLVLALLNFKFSRFAKLRNHLSTLGDSSYSLYLVHPILAPAIILALLKIGLHNTSALLFITVIGSIFGSKLIYKYIERPLTQIANHFLGLNNKKPSKNLQHEHP